YFHSIIYSNTYLIDFYFFFNNTTTSEIYTLSLHDALPISSSFNHFEEPNIQTKIQNSSSEKIVNEYDNAIRYNDYIVRNIINLADRKSTRLNSSHVKISYAVFCLKKKKVKTKELKHCY